MIYKNKEQNIEIAVEPSLEESQTSEAHSFYFYTYKVTIRNLGKEKVQLLERKWIIKDGNGREELVEGEGVVGLQPIISPNETFDYNSFCPLRTKTGNMRGYYTFIKDNEIIKIKIPLFFLRPDNFSIAKDMH